MLVIQKLNCGIPNEANKREYRIMYELKTLVTFISFPRKLFHVIRLQNETNYM